MDLFSVQCKTLPVSVTVTASTPVLLPSSGNTIRVVSEDGSDDAFVAVSATPAAATLPNATPTATSTIVRGGFDATFSLPNSGVYYVSAICRSGKSAALCFQVGEGI